MTPQEGGFAEWFQGNLWALWGILAVLLATLEMATLDLTLLMLALGAVAGGLTSLVIPGAYWLQVLVALGVATALQTMARPSLLRRLDTAPGYRSSLGKLVGSAGVALERTSRSGGQVKVNGETWSARTLDPDVVVEPGDEVEVYEVDGVTLVVYPVRGGELLPGTGLGD